MALGESLLCYGHCTSVAGEYTVLWEFSACGQKVQNSDVTVAIAIETIQHDIVYNNNSTNPPFKGGLPHLIWILIVSWPIGACPE